jgi:hypothetical protein
VLIRFAVKRSILNGRPTGTPAAPVYSPGLLSDGQHQADFRGPKNMGYLRY